MSPFRVIDANSTTDQFPLELAGPRPLVFSTVRSIGSAATVAEAACQLSKLGAFPTFLSIDIRERLASIGSVRGLQQAWQHRYAKQRIHKALESQGIQTAIEVVPFPSRLHLDKNRQDLEQTRTVMDFQSIQTWSRSKSLSVFSAIFDHFSLDYSVDESLLYRAAVLGCTYDKVFEIANRWLGSGEFTDVVVLNGRWPSAAAALESARQLDVPRLLVETGSTFEHVHWFARSPHSFEEWHSQMRANWNRAQPLYRESTASAWFTKWQSPSANPYIALQTAGSGLPNSGKKRLVFYAGSDHESAEYADAVDPGNFQTQVEVVEFLVDFLDANEWEIVVRSHPVQSGRTLVAARNDKEWENLHKSGAITLIGGLSPVSSYQLAREANLNITFGSNIGAELVYEGLPVLVAGPSHWTSLVPEIECLDAESMSLALKDLPARPAPERVLPFAFFHATRGIAFDTFAEADRILRSSVERRISRALGKIVAVGRRQRQWMP